MQLNISGRLTHAAYKLIDGSLADGAAVQRRRGGWSDINIIKTLVTTGWLEARATGPRGGVRYFTTPAGEAALAVACAS